MREDLLKLTDSLTRLFIIFREENIKNDSGENYCYETYRAGYTFYTDFSYGMFDRIMLMSKEDLMLEIGKELPKNVSLKERIVFNRDQAILRWRLQEGF
jgi:hypothetical protein